MPELNSEPLANSLQPLYITPTDVLDILKSLPVEKVSGLDGINDRILKECQHQPPTPVFFKKGDTKVRMIRPSFANEVTDGRTATRTTLTDGRTDGQTDGRTDGRTDGQTRGIP
ncbi:hypothetical protein DPMN_056086 [Dreissena polymorpha]|uniref:Uncharacterized protein n=1 Tax=Dreissena polymorpha TaxID=45954 RepID=A0A9D4HT64_DREPO|nr:hypothetical protein DPMN_056086 [Dreissena polymorpha]